MPLNGNFTSYELPKSDLLQKHLMKQSSFVPQNGIGVNNVNGQQAPNVHSGVQNAPYLNNGNNSATTPSVLHTSPEQDVYDKKNTPSIKPSNNNSKNAKIAAASLGGIMVIAAGTLIGKTNAGRKLLKQTGSLISTACEKTLQKLRNSFGSEKVDNIIRGFFDFRDNKLAKFNAVPENLVNGKDVFSRNAADFVTGRKVDMSKLSGSKKKAVEIYKATVGRILSWFHLLDKHTTKLYENESIKGGVKKYVKASSKYSEYSATTRDQIKKALSQNPDKKFKIAGKEQTGSELLKSVESLFDDTGKKVANLTSEANAKGRMTGYNNMLKGLDKEGNKTAQSLTERATDGFMEKIRGKKAKDLLTEPIAGTILQNDKIHYAQGVKSTVDSITRTASTVIEETAGDIASLKKVLGTSDIDTYTEIDKTIRLFDRYKKTIFDGTMSSAKVQNEICNKLDDLIIRVSNSNNPNSAKAIETLQNVKKSLSGTIKGGATEEIMDIAREVLDTETYNKIVLPKYKNFQKSLQGAYHNEVSDVLDKLRDVNCGSAPTDFMTLIGSTVLFGVYAAQAEDNNERVSLTLTTGLPLISTMGTNLICAMKSISGGKSMAISLLAGAVTKKVCDGLNKIFRKSKGLDQNNKPSVVTINDYIPYKNKFGELFMVPPDTNINTLNNKTLNAAQMQQIGAVRLS